MTPLLPNFQAMSAPVGVCVVSVADVQKFCFTTHTKYWFLLVLSYYPGLAGIHRLGVSPHLSTERIDPEDLSIKPDPYQCGVGCWFQREQRDGDTLLLPT